MNGCGFGALILGTSQLNQTFLTAGLDSKLFFVIVIKFFYLFIYLFFAASSICFESAGWCLPRNCRRYPGRSTSRTTAKASDPTNRSTLTRASSSGGRTPPSIRNLSCCRGNVHSSLLLSFASMCGMCASFAR